MIAIKAFFKKNKAPLAERDTRCQRRCGLVLGYTLLRRGSRRQPSVSGARGCRLMLQAKGGTHANWTTDIDKKRPRSRAGRSLVKVFWRTGFCKIQELGSGKPGHRPQHALNERTSDEANATPKERGSQVFFSFMTHSSIKECSGQAVLRARPFVFSNVGLQGCAVRCSVAP